MITLHQFASIHGRSLSPYCLKVEVYLQLAKIPYKIVESLPQQAPLKKLPFIEDKEVLIPDSRLIIEYLKSNYGNPLDDQLSPEQRAQGYLLENLCEKSLIYPLLYMRWVDESHWSEFRDTVFHNLPPIINFLVPLLLRKKIKKKLAFEGITDHHKEQIYAFGAADLDTIATYLSKHSFAVGNQPSSFDASLYAFLSNIFYSQIESPLKKALLSHSSLTDYCARINKILSQV